MGHSSASVLIYLSRDDCAQYYLAFSVRVHGKKRAAFQPPFPNFIYAIFVLRTGIGCDSQSPAASNLAHSSTRIVHHIE
jgi:hypothetical protein